MNGVDVLYLFQGIATLMASEPSIAIGRIVFILLGIAFVYLGFKGVLEGLIMIPMRVGMAAVNGAVLHVYVQ